MASGYGVPARRLSVPDARFPVPMPGGVPMFEQRLYKHLDWSLLGAVLLLCVFGLVMIYSTTYDPIRGRVGREFYTQLSAVGIGLVAMTVMLLIDYRTLSEYAPVFYGGVAVLLLYVLFFGVVAGGSRRWISLVVFNLQPSEFAKAALALLLATWFGQDKLSALRTRRPRGRRRRAAAAVPPHRAPAGPRLRGHVAAGRSAASPTRPACACG